MYVTLYILAPILVNFSPYFYYFIFRAPNDSIGVQNLTAVAPYAKNV